MEREGLRIHKNLLIRVLREHPEDVGVVMPDYKTAADAIAALEEHPGTWIVDGVLTVDSTD
jgi:hypothetical protein